MLNFLYLRLLLAGCLISPCFGVSISKLSPELSHLARTLTNQQIQANPYTLERFLKFPHSSSSFYYEYKNTILLGCRASSTFFNPSSNIVSIFRGDKWGPTMEARILEQEQIKKVMPMLDDLYAHHKEFGMWKNILSAYKGGTLDRPSLNLDAETFTHFWDPTTWAFLKYEVDYNLQNSGELPPKLVEMIRNRIDELTTKIYQTKKGVHKHWKCKTKGFSFPCGVQFSLPPYTELRLNNPSNEKYAFAVFENAK